MHVESNEIQKLIDKEAIRDVSLRYTRGIDRHDVELLLSAYHEGASDDHGSFIGSGEAFVEYANRVHSEHWMCHQHFVTNQVIDLTGDSAHCESYFFAVLKRPDGICDVVGGRYVDQLERRDAVWAVVDRICMVEWNIEAGPANMPMDPTLFVTGTWDKTDPSYRRPLRVDRAPRDLSRD